jgi:hypothetical protein
VDLTKLTSDALAEFKERATEFYLFLLCFDGINREKYRAVKNRILNNSLLGDDNKGSMLPKSFTELLHAMTCFKPERLNWSGHHQVGDETTAGTVAFAQTGSPCHACGKPDHWATECPCWYV